MVNRLTGVLALSALALYTAAVCKLQSPEIKQGTHELRPEHLKYGAAKYLTFQTLVAQILSTILHSLACFAPALFRKPRDIIFTAIAFPLSVFVSSTFWLVWAYDRELVFPKVFDAFFPAWLNHTVHTAILPVNLAFIYSERHRYFRFGFSLTVGHLAAYVAFLYYIKSETGYFVYPYLDKLGSPTVHYYYCLCAALMYSLYKLGALLDALAHGPVPSSNRELNSLANSDNNNKKRKQPQHQHQNHNEATNKKKSN